MEELLKELNSEATALAEKDILLEQVYRTLDSVPELNKGGCLIAAKAVLLYINKNYNFGNQINLVQISYDNYDSSLFHNKRFIKGEEDVAVAGNHFVLTTDKGKTLYDSEGFYELKKGYKKLIIPQKKTKEFIESALSVKENWNRSFNRTTGIKKINNLLNINLN